MSTRRSFLQSALLLPSLFAVDAFARDNASATFADFESGDYSDWTITGDAFGTKPATDALFPSKVRGFGGRAYASTFHPRRGVLATGKAVSREFTIEKPVITFRIGGGNHPGKACLNLVVDGKIERTETGDGSVQLLARSWDVSALVGKKAHLEIVDDTASDKRGYIMVDDIAFGDAVKNAGIGWRDKSVEPFFINKAKLWQGIDFRNGESPFPFDLPESDIQRAIDAVVVAIHAPDISLPPVAERSVERIAAQIADKVDATIAALNLPKVNPFTRQWLLAEGVCEWVRKTVIYDDELAKVEGQDDYRRLRATSKHIIGLEQPSAVCWGIAVTVRDLARAAGLKCDFVSVNLRHPFTPAPPQTERNHGVACFIFDGGIEVPADVSSTIGEDKGKRFVGRKTRSNWVLPRHPEAWELFTARVNGQLAEEMETSFDKQNRHLVYAISYDEWANRDIRYLVPLIERYERWEARRNVSIR